MSVLSKMKKGKQLYLIILPACAATFVFNYIPLYGVVLAFQKYNPTKNMFQQDWVGLRYFKQLFGSDDFVRIISNTLTIASIKIVSLLITALLLALLITEIRSRKVKTAVQSLLIFPHFLSWVVLGSVVRSLLDQNGFVNQFLMFLGMREPIFFMQDGFWFRVVLVVSELWKEAGFSGMIYMAAISGVDSTLYEAAKIDGANRLQLVWHITLKCIMPFVVLNVILNMPNVLNAGFDQVFILYNYVVLHSADIIDTYVYRVGLAGGQYAYGTAVGLFKSVVSSILIGSSYFIADKKLGFKVF